MRSNALLPLISASLLIFLTEAGRTAAADNDSLEGVWVATDMTADGKPAPADAVKRMRFTFKADKLLVRGNFDNDVEEECGYRIDAAKSPKQLDIQPPKEKQPILAIYDLKGDQLQLCLRHGGSSGGRPTEFASKPDSGLVLLVFKRSKRD